MPEPTTDAMMVAPDTCLYCGYLIVRDRQGIRHRAASPCREPRPCEYRERELRWKDWLSGPPWARTLGRGGVPHIVRYGAPGLTVCGLPVRPESPTGGHGCRACLRAIESISYAWRYEQHWRESYGGSAVADLAIALGLRSAREESRA